MSIKHLVAASTLPLALFVASIGPACAAAPDRDAIVSTLNAYAAALNASDTAAVMPLYEPDGVFMPPYSQSAIGVRAVRTAYDDVFKHIHLHVKFKIDEVVQMAPDWAFVRTNSAGHTTQVPSGASEAEANQELFVLHKDDDGKWRIARYSFSSTNPPPMSAG